MSYNGFLRQRQASNSCPDLIREPVKQLIRVMVGSAVNKERDRHTYRDYLLMPMEWMGMEKELKINNNLKGVYVFKDYAVKDAVLTTKRTIKHLKKKRLIKEICV